MYYITSSRIVDLTYGEFSMTDITDITTRRNFLTVAGGLAATIATSLAIAAAPGACQMPDPIFEAIANHRAAAQAFDTAHAGLVAGLPDIAGADDTDAQAALRAEIEAAKALIAIAPTTRTGLRALTEYLGEERQHGVSWYVEQTITVEGHTSTMRGRTGGIEWRVAELLG
jgi:hypothetical protein